MTIPKRQHVQPVLHLKHFVGAEPKGQVWTYDAETGTSRSAVPENTAVESHFYSAQRPDGTMDTRLEETLAKIESAAAPVYEGLLRGEIPRDEARGDFSTFLALMYVRTPAMRRMAAEVYGRGVQALVYANAQNARIFDRFVKEFEKDTGQVIDIAAKERLREDMLDPSNYVMEIPKEYTLSVLKVSDKLAPLFYDMKWSLVFAGQGYFITSDNPVVRLADPKTSHPIVGDNGFFNKTAEVSFPLSPKMMLIMSWQKDAPDIGMFERGPVDGANRNRAIHSDRYLYAHLHKRLERLAAKYKDSRPAMTTEGFGPKNYAEINVARRSRRDKDDRAGA